MKMIVKCIKCEKEFKIEIHAEEGYIEFVDGGCGRRPPSGLKGVVDLVCPDCDEQ